MPRESIAMTSQEVRGFLAEQRWVVLATLDADGSPWADVTACALEGDRLYFLLRRGSRSHENLARDARVCCSCDAFPSYYEIRGVSVRGQAERVGDEARRSALLPRLSDPGAPVADESGGQSDLYALSLDDVFSFDFAKIQDRF